MYKEQKRKEVTGMIAYGLMLVISTIFFAKLGRADAYKDVKKKKALWINAGAFAIGFIAGMLFFV